MRAMEFFSQVLFLCIAFTLPIKGSEIEVFINDTKPIFTVNSRSPSVALGMNIFRNGFQKYLNNPKLLTLAKGLGPLYLRMGGIRSDHSTFLPDKSPILVYDHTCHNHMPNSKKYQLHLLKMTNTLPRKNNTLTYTGSDFDLFMTFVKCAKWDLFFGLNFLGEKKNQWDPTNSLQLLSYAKKSGYSINWELGNEPNSYPHKEGFSVTPNGLAKAFNRLNNILKSDPWWKKSKIAGPDANGLFRVSSRKFLNKFLHYAGHVLNAATFHQYYLGQKVATMDNFTDSKLLDKLKPILKSVVEIQQRQTRNVPLWLGETSSAFGGGAEGLSNTFVAGFMWLDKLGLCAEYGIDMVFRQTFFHGYYALVDENFNPRPDYWLTLLYKNLVGPRVLKVSRMKDSTVPRRHSSEFRVYAHCTNSQRSVYPQGSVTVYYLNMSKHNKTLTIETEEHSIIKTAFVYILTAPSSVLNSSDVCLNEEKIVMTDIHRIPDLHPKQINFLTGEKLILPKMSFGFVILSDIRAPACL